MQIVGAAFLSIADFQQVKSLDAPAYKYFFLLNVWRDKAFMNHKTPPFRAFEGSMCNHVGQRSPLIFLSSGAVSTLGSALRNNLLNI